MPFEQPVGDRRRRAEHDDEDDRRSRDSLNSSIASGNHAIDGMVCRPVMNEPNADRSDLAAGDHAMPTATPMTSASA